MAALAQFPAPIRDIWQLPRAYLRRPLGCFCAHSAHRRLLYYQLGLFLLLAVLGGKLLTRQQTFLLNHLSFYFTYALHLSLTYLAGVILAEVAVRLLCPRWSAYKDRTVARQWLIWGLGFLMGFLLYRLVTVHLVDFYAPWLVHFLRSSPQLRPGLLEVLLFCGAIWSVATFVVIQSALRWQRHLGRRQRAAAALPAAAPPADAPPATLTVSHDGRQSRIPLERITHVTVEDHYCRIHYLDAQGPRNLFACMTLKSLAAQLPEKDFVQIHRSHLVNLRHMGGLERSEGQYLAVLPAIGAELSISRRRRAELQERLPGNEPGK
ncbi:MAG: LytTR family transcriptional regulator [Desulfarculaceae bacterium]|nr:LytTR family transcriptional regulator [Desulfarculaceae bacterium]MCF8099383.1 LytTR family transcriptional regulator [Desulfarculaceae bacterium]